MKAGAEHSTVDAASSTLATAVYGRLRTDVLSGILSPGEKLRMDALRRRYGASVSPLREALNRLAAEGLVARADQKGFRVSPASLDDLCQLTRARLWVNGIALREAIARGDAAWEERIVLAFHRMTRAIRQRTGATAAPEIDSDAARYHRAFHAALIDACGSSWITNFAGTLFDCARRYQHLSVRTATPPRDIEGEHRAIMEAALERDADRAVRLHDEHIMRTVDIVERLETRGADAEHIMRTVDIVERLETRGADAEPGRQSRRASGDHDGGTR